MNHVIVAVVIIFGVFIAAKIHFHYSDKATDIHPIFFRDKSKYEFLSYIVPLITTVSTAALVTLLTR